MVGRDPAGLLVGFSVINIETAVIGSAQQLSAVTAEGNTEDTELEISWTERETLVISLELELV